MPRRKRLPDNFVLLTGTANQPLAQKIAKHLRIDVDMPISQFADGEIRVMIPHNLRQKSVFIINTTSTPVNDHIMELVFMIDAAKRASAKEITAVVPYFGYSRQDRKEMPRVPISSSVVAQMIETAGADRIVTLDLHSEQQQGFVKRPWDNLYSSFALVPAIKKRKLTRLVVASPDKGGVVRATAFSGFLNAKGLAIVFKERDVSVSNKSEALDMIGEVGGKDVLLVDDIIDTAGTIVSAANFLKERGARSIHVAAVHGLFSEPALSRIEQSAIEKLLITDTIHLKDEVAKHPKVVVVSVAPLLAEAIRRIQTGESISSLIL